MSRGWLAVGTIVAILILGFGWPTPYRYIERDRGQSESIVRIHRVTGITEVFDGVSWRATERTERDSTEPDVELPQAGLSAIRLRASMNFGQLRIEAYNGSSWTVKRLVFRLPVHSERGPTSSDVYEVRCNWSPLSYCSENVLVFPMGPSVKSWNVELLSAWGAASDRKPSKDWQTTKASVTAADEQDDMVLSIEIARERVRQLVNKAVTADWRTLDEEERASVETIVAGARKRASDGTETPVDRELIKAADAHKESESKP